LVDYQHCRVEEEGKMQGDDVKQAPSNEDLLQAERDALGYLGLLTHAFLTWDPPIPAGTDAKGRPEITHFRGLNIQAFIVDNLDGEVLSLEKNSIHDNEDPTRHAEPSALRSAVARLRIKRPRMAGSVETYYRSQLFYAAGTERASFLRKGCTLFTSLEPCPMCAATLCVARMKRVVFLVPDEKYGQGWPLIKERFYPSYELNYGRLLVPTGVSPWLTRVHALRTSAFAKIEKMRADDVQDTWFLDRLFSDLDEAMHLLAATASSDFVSVGDDRKINERTLYDLKRLCRLPS
jgi:tRNA(Arg) A34 adenosine deaminase TadA